MGLFAVTRSADCRFTPATDNRAVVGSAQGDPTAYTLALAIIMVGSTVIRTVPGGIVASQRDVIDMTLASSSITQHAVKRSSIAFGRLSTSRRRRSGLPAAIVIDTGPVMRFGFCSTNSQPPACNQAT